MLRLGRILKGGAGRWAVAAAAMAALALAVAPAAAQRGSSDWGVTYSQELNKFVGSSTSRTFYLRGASMDYGYTLWRGLGVTASGNGLAATNLEGNIDIHQVEALAGVRYTYNWGHITPTVTARKGGLFVQAKAGYTFATSGLFPVNGTLASSASGLTYEAGGGFNLHVYDRMDVRLIEAEYVVSQLPNGGSNQQNAVRLSAGLNFHFGP